MEELIAGICGIGLGWLFCRTVWKGKSASVLSIAAQLNRNVDEAEIRFLECLRRELANEIMAEDTNAMYRAFHKMRQYEIDLRKAGKERIEADFKSICMKYPRFQDFDPFGTRHFIAYQDARSSMDVNDLIDNYSDISQFLIINAARKKLSWHLFDGSESEQLEKAIRKRRDRAFHARLTDAMSRYYGLCQATHDFAENNKLDSYHDGVVSVSRVLIEYSPEIGYGIHFSDTGEFGLHTVYFDYEKEKTYRSYYRSDAKFKEQDYLDI